jgi:hypothetical protein
MLPELTDQILSKLPALERYLSSVKKITNPYILSNKIERDLVKIQKAIDNFVRIQD